jgi:hypothetical protein
MINLTCPLWSEPAGCSVYRASPTHQRVTHSVMVLQTLMAAAVMSLLAGMIAVAFNIVPVCAESAQQDSRVTHHHSVMVRSMDPHSRSSHVPVSLYNRG